MGEQRPVVILIDDPLGVSLVVGKGWPYPATCVSPSELGLEALHWLFSQAKVIAKVSTHGFKVLRNIR
eukprot:618043-Prorocentrum_minimum.AAC.4